MLSRDDKRIANRSRIRLQTPRAKGFQQRIATHDPNGTDSRTGTADERPVISGMASLDGNRVAVCMENRMAIQDEERMVRHIPICAVIWSLMREVTPMVSGMVTRMGYGVFMAIAMRLQKRAPMPMLERMYRRVPLRLVKWV